MQRQIQEKSAKIKFHYHIKSTCVFKDEANGEDHMENSQGKLGKIVVERRPLLMALWHFMHLN